MRQVCTYPQLGDNGMNIKELTASFRKSLNSNGFGFQYSVLRLVEQLGDEGKSAWGLVASEFPVESRGNNTHIDFILKRMMYEPGNCATFIIGECKRANPALSNWCFAKAPYVRRGRYPIDPW